jgi:hypothetical protein
MSMNFSDLEKEEIIKMLKQCITWQDVFNTVHNINREEKYFGKRLNRGKKADLICKAQEKFSECLKFKDEDGWDFITNCEKVCSNIKIEQKSQIRLLNLDPLKSDKNSIARQKNIYTVQVKNPNGEKDLEKKLDYLKFDILMLIDTGIRTYEVSIVFAQDLTEEMLKKTSGQIIAKIPKDKAHCIISNQAINKFTFKNNPTGHEEMQDYIDNEYLKSCKISG